MKHPITHKLLSLLAAACLLLALLPTAALAVEGPSSGACGAAGNNVTWTLDGEGVLTISGTGAMADYSLSDNVAPWYPQRESVTEVSIEAGVTHIGEFAFYQCGGLTKAAIPDGVESIGMQAFRGCGSLTGVTIPDSVTTLGINIFYQCTLLANVTIGKRVESIPQFAFYQCENLTGITIPDSVTGIGNSAFSQTGLTSITIPSNVGNIGDYAFHKCANLTSATIQDGVTSIGDYAFARTGLTSISIPNSVESISKFAFADCRDLTALTLTRDPAPTLGEKVFYGCFNLSAVYVPDGAEGYDQGEWDEIIPVMALSGLTVSAGSLEPAFSPQVKNYNLILPAWAESFTVTPTLPGEGTVAVNGTEVPSGTTSQAFSAPLFTDQLIVLIKLTRDGARSSEYSISASLWRQSFPGGAISGVAAPVRGGTPAETAETEFSAGTVAWAPTPNGTFAAGTAYTATITLAPKTGCTLTGVEANSFTVAGAESVTNAAGSGVVTAVFPATGPAPGGGSDDSGPSYERRTLTDKATGVKVAGKQVYSAAKLTVEAGKLHAAGDPGCDLLRAARDAGHVLGAWDLSLSKAPKGGVTVSLPVEGVDGKTLTVAHCGDGALVLTDVEVTDGFAAVAADSLSPFAVLDGAYTLADLEALAAPPAENPFTDVAEGDWFYDAALYVYTSGLMTGTTETDFSPGVSMTRGMFVTVLYRLAGNPRDGGEGGAFTDIPAGAYCAAAVDWAAARGIVRGTSDDTFEPDRAVTRQEMAVILANYLQAWGRTLPQVPAPAAFTDRDAVAGWAVDAVEAMRTTGIFQGKDGGRFDPAGTATRAEAAALFQRLAHALKD